MWRYAYWWRFKENHPVLYEAIQWGVFAIAVAALIKSFLS